MSDLVAETRARTERLLKLLDQHTEGAGTSTWYEATFELLCSLASLLDADTLRRLAAKQEEQKDG